MPNSDELNGLQIRQVLNGRQILFYSPHATFTCAIKDGSWNRTVRVGVKQLPVTLEVDSGSPVQLRCVDEKAVKTFIFYVPAVEYTIPIVR